MPTKTDRILSYLPSTFRALPKPTVLFDVVDAFGAELLTAENSLAVIMQAHWVDHADRNAEWIDDLARIAALYGLAPRSDESVEEFRLHLKRYIRTFIEGTVTVQGILRIAAEALGLAIADSYADLETWWTRPDDSLATVEPRGDDAAALVFGPLASSGLSAVGADAVPATVRGSADLTDGVDLRDGSALLVRVDGGAPVAVDLLADADDPGSVSPDEVVEAIEEALGPGTAMKEGGALVLRSLTVGATSDLEVLDVEADAAPAVLGLAPRTYRGADATPARLTGKADLSSGVDLAEDRYLRIAVDGTSAAEVDCLADDPTQPLTTLDRVRDVINAAMGQAIASHDGASMTLVSPSQGAGSTIELQQPAAQDATDLLFGGVPRFASGSDAQPARAAGLRDVSPGVDLTEGSVVEVRLDGGAAVAVDCAGADTANTRPAEIVAALNAVHGVVAGYDGRFIRLASPTVGPAGEIVFETPVGDAVPDIFGFDPRIFRGADAIQARLEGVEDPPGDLRVRRRLAVSVDGAAPVEVDLRAGALHLEAVTPAEMAAAMTATLGPGLASAEGSRLVLTLPSPGGVGRIGVNPLLRRRLRRFVSRARITDEAATSLLGFIQREAVGAPATPARVVGQPDLSHGVDLSEGRFLRLAVDRAPAIDVDCRPPPARRVTTLEEIVANINAELKKPVASGEGGHLALTSPTSGQGSAIAFEDPRAEDALDLVLGVPPGTFRGRAGSGVSFLGTADLSDGIDLTAADRLSLGIDANPVQEISCAGLDPANTTIDEVVTSINRALGARIATIDGSGIRLTSPSSGAAAVLEIAGPVEGPDATIAVFGIQPPRSYQGRDSEPGTIAGTKDLAGGVDLRVARFIRIAIDGGAAVVVDCGSKAADRPSATPVEIANAVNEALESPVASVDGANRLVLTSPTRGVASTITLDVFTSANARMSLLGEVADNTTGSDASPAVVTGEVDLLQPVDLSQRSLLRLAIDGEPPVDVAVAGDSPAATYLEEVVSAIEARLPGVARSTEDDRLQLRSSTTEDGSRLSVLPLRYLEVVEYCETPQSSPPRQVRHADGLPVLNNGAADEDLEVVVLAPLGVVAPALVDQTSGLGVRLLTVVPAGALVTIRPDAVGEIEAILTLRSGAILPVPGEQILAGPLGANTFAPLSNGVLAAEQFGSGAVLRLQRGRTTWRYLETNGSRFNLARYDAARFDRATFDPIRVRSPDLGDAFQEAGVFDISRFSQPGEDVTAVYGPADPPHGTGAELTFSWSGHLPGTFAVNLPTDLPARFGARFNEERFSMGAGAPEGFSGCVTEPEGDPHDMVGLIQEGSKLVHAARAAAVPLGWSAVALPFRKPLRLTLGTKDRSAAIYLREEGVDGFIVLSAREQGEFGNQIAVTARKAGPGAYDVTVQFEAGRFENARKAVAGKALGSSAQNLLVPGPAGVLQAKGAGVRAEVLREGTPAAAPASDLGGGTTRDG